MSDILAMITVTMAERSYIFFHEVIVVQFNTITSYTQTLFAIFGEMDKLFLLLEFISHSVQSPHRIFPC